MYQPLFHEKSLFHFCCLLGAVKGLSFDQKGPTFRLCHGTQRQNWKFLQCRTYMLKKGAARFARRAFFVGVGPSNFAFVCCGPQPVAQAKSWTFLAEKITKDK